MDDAHTRSQHRVGEQNRESGFVPSCDSGCHQHDRTYVRKQRHENVQQTLLHLFDIHCNLCCNKGKKGANIPRNQSAPFVRMRTLNISKKKGCIFNLFYYWKASKRNFFEPPSCFHHRGSKSSPGSTFSVCTSTVTWKHRCSSKWKRENMENPSQRTKAARNPALHKTKNLQLRRAQSLLQFARTSSDATSQLCSAWKC